MNYIIEFNIFLPICQISSIFSAEMRPPLCNRAGAVSENVQDIPQDMLVLGFFFFNIKSIAEFYFLSLHDALPLPVYSLQKCDRRRVTARRRCLRMHSICRKTFRCPD